jgi:hypothetical protein
MDGIVIALRQGRLPLLRAIELGWVTWRDGSIGLWSKAHPRATISDTG